MLHHIASAVYKRAVEGSSPQYELPPWAWVVILADAIVFLPIIIILTYTIETVYPIFAIVEDENPPAYDPVNLNDDDANADAVPGVGPIPPKVTGGRPTTVTSSLRSINRLLMANGGWRANFRGFFCIIAQAIATGILYGVFSAFLPSILASLATLLASLSLVQLSTAWVHIVITPRSPLHFWSRLPPFKRTFEATARPVAAYWLATQFATWVPIAVGWALGLDLPNFRFGAPTTTVPGTEPRPNDAWKSVVITLLSIAFHVLVVIPAEVVLVRVQASLLPEEADTIIPFDRSFEGKVEPRVVGGKGYATMSQAWASFSRAAWRRLVILYAKIIAVTTAGFFIMAAVIIPEIILLTSKSTPKN
ncbi:ubiquitin conjugating [Colletotrichum truncatum]|uniref:Ubiquitin conjugating n=1 Tax=Colletotrichum truncatum TaxID=5467 RepID=A0ACC3ZKC6_COLTU|nr:ubiquitin conjugating [Colletotrichum truncatum]KAF6799721.1 ubiquitin conjugating [Colletotrichum truncatum]